MLVDATIGLSMFSFLDGFGDYNQIKMDPLDTENAAAAFRTPMGNLQYTVMPFRPKKAATYQ